MIDIHKLQQFVTLARMGNYTKASTELNLSQSALSRSIQSLEVQLGVRLLERERGKTGVSLTPSGTDLFRKVQALLEQMRDLETSVSGATPRIVRKLSFGLGPMHAGFVLSDVLKRTIVTNPDLAVTVYTGASDYMTGLLLDGEIEFYLGLASPRRQSPRIRHQLFARFSPGLYVRHDHPLLKQDSVSTDDVLRYPLISGTAWNEALVSLAENEDRYLFATTIQIDNYSIIAGLAAESDAVLISAVHQSDQGLVRLTVDISLTQSTSNYYVFTLAGVPLSPQAESMLRALQARTEEVTGASTRPGHPLPDPI